DAGERFGKMRIRFDDDAVGLGDLDDLAGDLAIALGGDARRFLAAALILQGNCDVAFDAVFVFTHALSSTKPPDFGGGESGWPRRTLMLPGSSPAASSESASSEMFSSRTAAVSSSSAQSMIEVFLARQAMRAPTSPMRPK